jgi:uncharacterized membrane protein
MGDRIRFFLKRLSERLWVKPFAMCVLSIAAVFLARTADYTGLGQFVPDITSGSIESLLSAISTSMLVIATFAVGSMVAAYASAGTTATPRSFSLVISDDVSQNALSTFIGAFIFSIVALVPLKNGYYGQGGRFALFALTLTTFAIVILTFVRWVDRIARLGRLGTTIDKVEAATGVALQRRREAPYLHGISAGPDLTVGRPVYGSMVGYVQRVDVSALQAIAEKSGARIKVEALPGAFCAPGRALAYVTMDSDEWSDIDSARIAKAFRIGKDRTFDEDPRFGLVVLSQIANRALSPGINDPGTAIEVIGVYVRLFTLWKEPGPESGEPASECERVEVPALSLADMFDDAFTAIARGGAGMVEVAVRLQKAFQSLAAMGDPEMRDVAFKHSRLALARAEKALDRSEDLEAVRREAEFPTDIFREI